MLESALPLRLLDSSKEADLGGDCATAKSSDYAGELVGTFTMNSFLPFWSAFALATILSGLVVAPVVSMLDFIVRS